MRSIAIFFGQFGPYHHARVAALQEVAEDQETRVVPVQIAAATSTYAWSAGAGACADLRTLCEGVEEGTSPLDVFLKARKLFREEKVDVAFLPSYSPARYFALFAAAKSLGIRTVMMNESHAGTEQATGWKRWIKRHIVKQFDAAFVGGEPHKRHFTSLGIPADKIFTGYDAVDNDFFASRADDIRAAAKKSDVWRVTSDESGEKPGAEHLSTLNSQPSTEQSLHSAYGLPERYFLSLGRMVEKKNLSTLVEAYARFARASGEKHGARSREHGVRETTDTRHTPVALVFVGSGELERALREQAQGLGLRVVDRTDAGPKTKRLKDEETKGPQSQAEPRLCETGLSQNCKPNTENSVESDRGAVYFYGFRQIEENPVFYALAEAFVLPSLKEEWGLVVNEAMAAGLPVIVSRTAGCAEDLVPASGSVEHGAWSVEQEADARAARPYLEQRSNGFVFDPSSVDALSEALRRIADQKTKRQKDQETDGLTQMGKRSREIVGKFSCENFAQQALRAAEAAGARATIRK